MSFLCMNHKIFLDIIHLTNQQQQQHLAWRVHADFWQYLWWDGQFTAIGAYMSVYYTVAQTDEPVPNNNTIVLNHIKACKRD